MTDVKENIQHLRAEINDYPGVRLVAVSKYQPVELIRDAYDEGQRVFGESHVQELLQKRRQLPDDIQWHFIGHLQRNKVKDIAPFISMIESVDSERLLVEIDKQAARCGRVIDCLLELHIAREQTKTGFSVEPTLGASQTSESADALWRLLDTDVTNRFPNARICGLMTIASNVSDDRAREQEFREAAQIFQRVKADYFAEHDYFCERSWGMSDDYRLAIRQQATIIRVGTLLFGERNYTI